MARRAAQQGVRPRGTRATGTAAQCTTAWRSALAHRDDGKRQLHALQDVDPLVQRIQLAGSERRTSRAQGEGREGPGRQRGP